MIIWGLGLLSVLSCSDLKFGDAFLEKAPGVDITIDTVFSSKQYSDRALVAAYATLRSSIVHKINDGTPYEYQSSSDMIGWDCLDAITDIIQTHCTWAGAIDTYYNANYSASNEDNSTSTKMSFDPDGGAAWKGIRRGWIYIENVDRVPDMTAAEKKQRKGEARMVIACQYHELLRHFGGVPLLKSSVSTENDGGIDYSRKTYEETARYIIELCDQAAQELPWTVSAADDGRFTAASAMALKTRVLLYLASPLVNSDSPFLTPETPTAANQAKMTSNPQHMTWLGDYQAARWQEVVDACEDFFEENARNGNPYKLYNDGDPRSSFSHCYADRYNGEILISSARNLERFGLTYHNNIYGNSAIGNQVNNNSGEGVGCITLNYVDMFQDMDGKPVLYKEWIEKYGHEVTWDFNPFVNRDPRLYESVMINGDRFRERCVEMFKAGASYGREASYEFRYKTGFCMRKYLWDHDDATFNYRPCNWSYMRLAEVYLIYAEALNETGRFEEALQQLNMTRRRVGLPDMTFALLEANQGYKTLPSYTEPLVGNAKLREEILDERAREFCFEEVRWFDIIRWKREDIFRKKLYKVHFDYISGGQSTPNGEWISYDNMKFNYSDPEEMQPRVWAENFSPKWYFSALPPKEINKAYGLVQNPGW